MTVWFTDEAVAAWWAEPRTTPGGQPHYSALAISTALTMGMVFGLALRQTEGLIGSVIGLLGLDLAVPDHSALSRRGKTLEVPQLRGAGTGPLQSEPAFSADCLQASYSARFHEKRTDRCHNPTRRHSALAFRSPIQYEMTALAAAQVI